MHANPQAVRERKVLAFTAIPVQVSTNNAPGWTMLYPEWIIQMGYVCSPISISNKPCHYASNTDYHSNRPFLLRQLISSKRLPTPFTEAITAPPLTISRKGL